MTGVSFVANSHPVALWYAGKAVVKTAAISAKTVAGYAMATSGFAPLGPFQLEVDANRVSGQAQRLPPLLLPLVQPLLLWLWELLQAPPPLLPPPQLQPLQWLPPLL